jgi:hypothetical protein
MLSDRIKYLARVPIQRYPLFPAPAQMHCPIRDSQGAKFLSAQGYLARRWRGGRERERERESSDVKIQYSTAAGGQVGHSVSAH